MDFPNIRDFYYNNQPDLKQITKPNWRQFRFVLSNGRFFKVPDQIVSSEKLKKWLIKKAPSDVYYTTSCFMTPQLIGRTGDKISENFFVFGDLVFDIDFQPYSEKNIERARKEALRLLDFLQSQGIREKYVAFSGSKGFHIVCEDPWQYEAENPVEREKEAKAKRKIIAEEILNKGIKIDGKVTVDTRRILRLPGTINSKTGLECRIVTRQELEMPAKEIIEKCKKVNKMASAYYKRKRLDLAFLCKISEWLKWLKQNSKTKYKTFLSNSVKGTKMNCPIIEFKERKKNKVIELLRNIQSTYSLNSAFVFRGKNWFAILPYALQKKRVEKILKAANSLNYNAFKKYGETFTQISAAYDEKMEEVEKCPCFHSLVQINVKEKKFSKSHLKFISDCDIEFQKTLNGAGEENYKLSHSMIET